MHPRKRSFNMISDTIPHFLCELILTEDCNLRCKYCYENANRCSNSYMSFDIAKKSADFVLDYAFNHGIGFVVWTFFGGEPLLNLDVMVKFLHYAVDKANQYGIKSGFSLITNGTIYNKQYEEFILDWYKATKKVNIQISTDGIPEVQDKNRASINGQPTSGTVLNNILKLKAFLEQNHIDYKSSFHTHSIITKDAISKFFLNYKYFRQLGINHVEFMLSYNEAWEESDIPEYIEQLSLIADYVYGECIEACSLIPYENARLIIGLKPPAPIIENKRTIRRLEECAIVPNGDIYSFENMYFHNRNFKLGNIFDGIIESNNSIKTFLDACQSSNDTTCFQCGRNMECDKYKNLIRFKYNEAKKAFLIETKKRFDKLSGKLNYNKCNELKVFNAIN